MQDLLDLTGASGADYRFRRVEDPARLPTTAGNFLYVRWRGSTPQVLCCGAVNSLVEASDRWDFAVRSHGAQGLYVRLNVARPSDAKSIWILSRASSRPCRRSTTRDPAGQNAPGRKHGCGTAATARDSLC